MAARIPGSLTQRRIGKSTGERIPRAELQPARPLSGGDVDGTAQRCGGSFGFPGAISQLAIDSPQLGLEIALVAAV